MKDESRSTSQVQKDIPAGRSGHASLAPQPFQLRGRFLTAVALRLESDHLDKGFYDSLDTQLRRAPQLLLDAPLILDFGQVPGLADPEALRELVNHLKARNLHVFGVQNATAATREATARLGLIPVQIGRDIPAEQVGAGGRRRAGKPLAPANLLVTEPVRSGRVVVADRGDLVVVGSVSSGAELIAAGNIHVYGTLRGRAFAGAHGDETARIFCQRQEAELLAIAGIYRISDSIDDTLRHQSLQVFLKDDGLHLEALA